MTTRRLEGKVAVITGAAGGIGSASAARFVAEGARVVLADLASAGLSELARSLSTGDEQRLRADDHGQNDALGEERAIAIPTDVSDPDAVAACVDLAVRRFGSLDVMFANAGIEGAVGPIVDMPTDNLDRVLAVNVRGALSCIKHAARAMTKGGVIVVTSSVAGFIGAQGLSAYCASKHAVMGLVKCAAIELAPLGIRVCAINPGPIDNRMMRSIEHQSSPNNPRAVKEGFQGMVPLRRYGTNLEVANLALFLASDEASYCTGSSFAVDGGFLAM